MSAHEPMAVHPQAHTRAGPPMDVAAEMPVESARSKANCAQCGRAWFGEVAWCPYCGRPSASAPESTPQVHDEPPAAPPPPVPRASKRAPGKAALAAAAALAAIAIVVGLAVTNGDRPGLQGARRVPASAPAIPRTGTSGANTRATVPPAAPALSAAPAVRRAEVEQPQQPPAPPAPHRSLCSAANEAAGLCNPQ